MLRNFLTAFGIFLAVLALPFWVLAQEGNTWRSSDPDTSVAHLPTKMLNDFPNLFAPENAIPFTVGTWATAGDWLMFDKTNTLAKNLKSLNLDPLWNFGDFYGEGWVEGFSAVGCWSIGGIAQDAKTQEFGRDLTEALIESTILVEGLKYSVGRTRPDGSDNTSFPSGHTITAFCVAPVFEKYWGPEAGIPAYAFGVVTAAARVAGYHHYFSDVVAGATMGYLIGSSVVYGHKDVSVSAAPGQVEVKLAFD